MATNYPTSIDDGTSLPNPGSTDKTNSPSHSAQHSTENDAIKALETKLGTGSSTPSNNTFLIGNGAGSTTYSSLTSAQLAARLSDETGSGLAVFGTSPTLVTPSVDVINESTPAAGVTIDGVLLKDAKMNGSYITDSTVSYSQLASGVFVQGASTTSSAVATGTTTVPVDDTIPQNTEGTEFMTLSITPKSASHILVIQVNAFIACSNINNVVGALFQNSTADAIAASAARISAADSFGPLMITHRMAAGTTSSTTFKVRIGPQSAGTITFNGAAAGRYFGAITKSSIVISEYKA